MPRLALDQPGTRRANFPSLAVSQRPLQSQTMPYNCPVCPTPVDPPVAPSRGASVPCPVCSTPLTFKMRSHASDQNAYSGALNPAKKAKHSHAARVAPGRAPAAPARVDWPGTNLSANLTHCPSLNSSAWKTPGAGKIRLAYNNLDTGRSGMEGLLIDCPEMIGKAEVIQHFGAVCSQLVAAHNDMQVCEATGEAAAALCILKKTSIGGLTLAGFTMEWGLHVHSGPGIDQIWKRTGTNNEYLIVEAKGPGASLTTSPMDAPNDFDQMAIRWIMHNLVTMSKSHLIAQDILAELELTTGTRWPASTNPQQGSKNYYGVTGVKAPPRARLYGVVVTAKWLGDGMLDYSATGFKQYTNFSH
jgi:hypothetical protein